MIQVYGNQIIEALKGAGVIVNCGYEYMDLTPAEQDLAVRTLINCNDEILHESVPGAAEFGNKLGALFFSDSIWYVGHLRNALIAHAKLDTSISLEDSLVHSAELLECEATVRAGINNKQLLMLLFSDPFQFVHIASKAMCDYLNDYISNEIDDVTDYLDHDEDFLCH